MQSKKKTGVAQLVEQWSPKPCVGRSSRSSRAKFLIILYMFRKIKSYITESYEELVQKVSWPTWKELQSSAIVVSVASLIFALVVYLMDTTFSLVLEQFYKLF